MYRRKAFYILDDDTDQYGMVERIVCHDPAEKWLSYARGGWQTMQRSIVQLSPLMTPA